MYKEKPLVRRHYLHFEGKLEVTVKAETKQAFLERIFFFHFFFVREERFSIIRRSLANLDSDGGCFRFKKESRRQNCHFLFQFYFKAKGATVT